MVRGTWKRRERQVAALLGTVRSGATGTNTNDVRHPVLAVEIKARGKMPKLVTDAMDQARTAKGARGKLPVLVLIEEGQQLEDALCAARPECKGVGQTLHVWNLRGHNADLTLLRPKLEEQLARHQFGLIILDPAYKVLGNRDENANGEIADLMNELEALAQRTGAALVVAQEAAARMTLVAPASSRRIAFSTLRMRENMGASSASDQRRMVWS